MIYLFSYDYLEMHYFYNNGMIYTTDYKGVIFYWQWSDEILHNDINPPITHLDFDKSILPPCPKKLIYEPYPHSDESMVSFYNTLYKHMLIKALNSI